MTARKQAAYNYLELKAVYLALKELKDLCFDKIVLCSNRQHHSGVIHKQRGRHTWCFAMENPDLVYQENSTGPPASGCTQPAMGGSGHICLPYMQPYWA